GVNEIHFLHTLENEERRERIENLVRYTPPCFIVTDNQTGLENMIRYCTERNIPLLRAVESNYEFIGKLDAYLIKRLAPETAIHGVCVNVSGLGVLLRGESGVGKSETAHSIVGRGHRLVADDMVVLKRLSTHTLIGPHNDIHNVFISLCRVGLLKVIIIYVLKSFTDYT